MCWSSGFPVGASGLYAAIKQAGTFALSICEISNSRQLGYFREHPGPRIAKLQLPRLFRMNATLADEQTVLVARDPRDAVVSWLLSRPLLSANLRNHSFLAEFTDHIKKKEGDPLSVPVGDLLEVCHRHGLHHQGPSNYRRMFDLEDRLTASAAPDLLKIRYEDFVQGKTAAVAAALGLGELNHADLAAHDRHNQRAGGTGSWRHWFTAEDVEMYRPVFDPYLQKWGYGADDWRLSERPQIDPATSSEHISQGLRRLRELPPAHGGLLPREAYDAARIAMLNAAADDRCEPFMVELALACRDGYGVATDPARAVALLREAATLGNAKAMVHLSLALRHGVGTRRDVAGADRWEESATQTFGSARIGQQLDQGRTGWERAAQRTRRNDTVSRLLGQRRTMSLVSGARRKARAGRLGSAKPAGGSGARASRGRSLPPIIIGGMARSGTTFLAALLNAHHGLAITAEMNPRAAEALLDLHEHLTAYMRRQERRQRVWNAKRGQFIIDSWCNVTNDRLFEDRIDPRIGHKTPGAEHLFERYEDAFAPVRPVLLYCLREGSAVIRSLLNIPWNPVRLDELIERYKASVSAYERLQASRPGRVRRVQIDRMPPDTSGRLAVAGDLFGFLGHDVNAGVREFVEAWQPRNTRSSWQGATWHELTRDELETIRSDDEFMAIQRRYGYA